MKIKPVSKGLQVFLITWLGQMISLIGSGLTSFALGVWVFQRTSSPTLFAIIGFFTVLPKVILSPIAGVIVDRFDRRKVLIWADSGAGLSTIFLAGLLFFDQLEIWHIYLAATINSLCNSFQWPAYTATVSQLIPKKHLGQANGMNQFGRAAAEIFSPLMAGILVLSIQLEGVILIDVATFIFAVLTLSLVRFTSFAKIQKPFSWVTFKEDLTLGWKYIFARVGFRYLLFFLAIVNFIWGMVGALIVPMILSFTTSDRLGMIITVAGLGMLSGSLLMTIWGGPKRKILGVLIFEFISGFCFILMGLRPEIFLVAIGAFGAHITIAIVFGSNQALWQTKIETKKQGRVFATQQMFASIAAPIAYLSAGPLAENIFEPWLMSENSFRQILSIYLGSGIGRGIGLMFVLMGLVKITVSVLGLLNHRVRFIEDEIPDAHVVT